MATQLKEQHEQNEGVGIPGEGEGGEQEQQQGERDFEAEAREHGWTPLSEFKGDPSRFIDAETFMKRADEMMPLLKAQNARLKRDLDGIKKDLRKATAHFEGAEKRAFDRAKTEIEERIEAAIEVGDLAAGRAALKEMDELKPTADAPAGQYTIEDAQEAYDDFRDAHIWYDKANLVSASETEQLARIHADKLMDKLTRGVPHDKLLPPTELFAQVADAVYEKYPALKNGTGTTPRQKPASAVEGGGQGRIGRSNAQSWDNLPETAKRQYQRFMDRGIGVKDGDIEAAKKYYARTHDWKGYQE